MIGSVLGDAFRIYFILACIIIPLGMIAAFFLNAVNAFKGDDKRYTIWRDHRRGQG